MIVKKRKKWKHDLIGTENWLNEMHIQGKILKIADLKKGQFVFGKGTAEKYYYKIGYAKGLSCTPSKFLNNGEYEEVCFSNNYYIIKTQNEKPLIAPSYDDYFTENYKKENRLIVFLSIYTIFALPIAIIMFVLALIDTINGELAIAPFIVINVMIALFLTPILISYLSLKRVNRGFKSFKEKYDYDLGIFYTIHRNTIISKEEIKQLKKEKRYLKKIKLAWHYSPDKLEKWLEKMEENGFNLIKVGKAGVTFHFSKGKTRKIKYYVDIQKRVSPDYYKTYINNDWKLCFTNKNFSWLLTIWAKEYNDTVPLFLADKSITIQYAKKVSLTFGIGTFIIFFLLAFCITLAIIRGNFLVKDIPFLVILFIFIIEYGYFAYVSYSYYLRLKINKQNGL